VKHDAKGNLTRNAGDTVDRYTWDFDNRLAAADTDQDGSDDVTFTYDALGRRVSKDTSGGATRYIRTGQRVIEEYASTGGAFTLQRSYVYGSYIDDILAKVEDNAGSPTIVYYHRDRQYSVRGLTDNSGAIVELYAYSPYGKQVILDASGTVRTATAHNNFYGFTGRYLDPETGLWYFRARYFDADQGRFIGRDPLGYPDGMSSYAGYHIMHVGVDPTGRQSEPLLGGLQTGNACRDAVLGEGLGAIKTPRVAGAWKRSKWDGWNEEWESASGLGLNVPVHTSFPRTAADIPTRGRVYPDFTPLPDPHWRLASSKRKRYVEGVLPRFVDMTVLKRPCPEKTSDGDSGWGPVKAYERITGRRVDVEQDRDEANHWSTLHDWATQTEITYIQLVMVMFECKCEDGEWVKSKVDDCATAREIKYEKLTRYWKWSRGNSSIGGHSHHGDPDGWIKQEKSK
jgi:RHS repeat-associated protein